MIIKCIAIDDEPLALDIIKNYCSKISFLNLTETFTNTTEAKKYLDNNTIDLIFLDIQMPDITGIQFYRNLSIKPMVVFTTAYSDYAVEGFNVEAIDYLIKPIEYERFLKACYKAKEYLEFLTSQEVQLNSIFIKANYQVQKINLKEIDLIEALDDYIKIYIKPQPVLTLMTLKGILEKLPVKEFIRVHRSYIVPISKVESFSKSKLVVAQKEIPIGNSYANVFEILSEKAKEQ
jgi:DNA-binding LytR/AlgR family response regulator